MTCTGGSTNNECSIEKNVFEVYQQMSMTFIDIIFSSLGFGDTNEGADPRDEP